MLIFGFVCALLGLILAWFIIYCQREDIKYRDEYIKDLELDIDLYYDKYQKALTEAMILARENGKRERRGEL